MDMPDYSVEVIIAIFQICKYEERPQSLVTKSRGKALHFVPQGTLSTFSMSAPYDSQQTLYSDQPYLAINVKM